MANPTTREEFKEYCLRKLGKPVLKINVAPEQVEDRVDEALETWREKHYDATEEQWVHYSLTQDDIDNGYITVPDDVLTVLEILPVGLGNSGFASKDMFSYQYQIMAGEMQSWQPFDSLDYFIKMTSIDEIRMLTDPEPRFRYVRHQNKVKIYNTYETFVGQAVAMRIFKIVPDTDIWNDKWLKEYGTALIKRQWAENVSKFENIQLLGGVTINGERLMQEALQEIEQLEETLNDTYMLPTDFLFG